MSKVINALVGKACKITKMDATQISGNTIILDVDTDWIKIENVNKKGAKSIEIMRIEDICKINLIVE
ncbi:MAG: hypothetical protein ACK5L0_05010 [Candidatus Fimivivens sp.]